MSAIDDQLKKIEAYLSTIKFSLKEHRSAFKGGHHRMSDHRAIAVLSSEICKVASALPDLYASECSDITEGSPS